MTQPHEIHAWLGEHWTDEQITQITDEYLRIEPDIPEDEREALLTAIAQRVDGTLDPVEVMQQDTQAHVAASDARDQLKAAVRASISGGMSEAEAARVYCVTRMTVRSWIGKQ